MLRIKNFLRWLMGRKEVSNLYYNNKDFTSIQDLWDHIDTRGRDKEAFLIVIDKNNISCYARINKENSTLNEAVTVALDQINGNK